MFSAIIEGKLEKVRQLLDKGAGVNQTDSNGRTPLYLAVREGSVCDFQFNFLFKKENVFRRHAGFGYVNPAGLDSRGTPFFFYDDRSVAVRCVANRGKERSVISVVGLRSKSGDRVIVGGRVVDGSLIPGRGAISASETRSVRAVTGVGGKGMMNSVDIH